MNRFALVCSTLVIVGSGSETLLDAALERLLAGEAPTDEGAGER